ncbi:RICIN domain-containing protein [Polaribacter sp. M15]
MKKITYKPILLFFTLFSLYIPAQDVPPPDGVFRIQNVAIGKYLRDVGSCAKAVTMSDSGEETNTHWTFVESGSYFNIISESFGIIRATGSGFENGEKPYYVVSTSKAAPASV